MQQRPVPIAAGHHYLSRMLGQQLVEVARAALLNGGDDLSVEAQRIDARLQHTPTLESIIIGDRELGLVELCRRIVQRNAASCSLAAFLSQSMWGCGGRASGLEHPLFLRPPPP